MPFDTKNNKCTNPPIFDGIHFYRRDHQIPSYDLSKLPDISFPNEADISEVNFDGSLLRNVQINRIEIDGFSLIGGEVQGADIVGSRVSANLSDTTFSGRIVNSLLIGVESTTRFVDVELSGSNLVSYDDAISDVPWDMVWAWADMRPTFQPFAGLPMKVELCAPPRDNGGSVQPFERRVSTYSKSNKISWESASREFPN